MIEGMVKELIDCGLVPDAERYAGDPEGPAMAMYDLGRSAQIAAEEAGQC